MSIEDIVVDTQFVPETLEEVGKVCGFSGEGHFCHKGTCFMLLSSIQVVIHWSVKFIQQEEKGEGMA